MGRTLDELDEAVTEGGLAAWGAFLAWENAEMAKAQKGR